MLKHNTISCWTKHREPFAMAPYCNLLICHLCTITWSTMAPVHKFFLFWSTMFNLIHCWSNISIWLHQTQHEFNCQVNILLSTWIRLKEVGTTEQHLKNRWQSMSRPCEKFHLKIYTMLQSQLIKCKKLEMIGDKIQQLFSKRIIIKPLWLPAPILRDSKPIAMKVGSVIWRIHYHICCKLFSSNNNNNNKLNFVQKVNDSHNIAFKEKGILSFDLMSPETVHSYMVWKTVPCSWSCREGMVTNCSLGCYSVLLSPPKRKMNFNIITIVASKTWTSESNLLSSSDFWLIINEMKWKWVSEISFREILD